MNKQIGYVINQRNGQAISVSAYIQGKAYNLNSGHANFKMAIAELTKDNPSVDKLKSLFDISGALNSYSAGTVSVAHGQVFYNNQPVHGVITNRIIDFMRQGLPYKPLVKFLENLMRNTSNRSQNELYAFLEALNNSANGTPSITLTSDGCFLAYKGVRNDYYSITSGNLVPTKGKVQGGMIYNGIGEVIEVDRGAVDDDQNRTCSHGLHVGSYAYARSFAGSTGRIVLVKVNPKDVVSIPSDCNGQKCRTSAYEVVDLVQNDQPVQAPYADDYDDVTEDSGEVRQAKQRRDSKGRFVAA